MQRAGPTQPRATQAMPAKGLCAPSPREAEPAAPQPVLGVRRHVCPVWSCSGLRRACHPKRKATFLEVLPRSVGRSDRTLSRCSRGSSPVRHHSDVAAHRSASAVAVRRSAKRAAVGAHSRAAAPTAVALAAALAATTATATPSMAAAAALNADSCFAVRHRGNECPFRQFWSGE